PDVVPPRRLAAQSVALVLAPEHSAGETRGQDHNEEHADRHECTVQALWHPAIVNLGARAITEMAAARSWIEPISHAVTQPAMGFEPAGGRAGERATQTARLRAKRSGPSAVALAEAEASRRSGERESVLGVRGAKPLG